MKSAFAAFVIVSALVGSACVVHIDDNGWRGEGWWNHEIRHGSGVSASEARQVGDFRRVVTSGSIDVQVTCGHPQAVSVTADDNLLEYLETEVQGGALHVGMKSGSYSFEVAPRVSIALPALDALVIEGSGGAEIGGVDQPALELGIEGSGEIRAAGRVERVRASVSGSGEMHLFDLASRDASVSISGSGSVEVQAEGSLSASVSGSGDVIYRGSAGVDANVSGSGSVRRD